jgi:hypothetical protein
MLRGTNKRLSSELGLSASCMCASGDVPTDFVVWSDAEKASVEQFLTFPLSLVESLDVQSFDVVGSGSKRSNSTPSDETDAGRQKRPAGS